MVIAIHQPQYLPWLGYFHKMLSADAFVILDDVQFKKNEWQHRNRIRNAQGWQWLSVPNSYHFPERINEVNVRNETRWQETHLKSLRACYGKAAHFGEYAERLAQHYAGTWDTIDKVNSDSIRLLASFLGITTEIHIASEHGFAGTSTERLVNICRHFGADTYLAGAGGKDYMDLGLFEKAGIRVEFQEFACPRYTQHWSATPEDFVPNLSSIDLVLNCGENSPAILHGKGHTA